MFDRKQSWGYQLCFRSSLGQAGELPRRAGWDSVWKWMAQTCCQSVL